MSSGGSVSHWIVQLQAGDHRAAQKLWERYFQRLVGLARKKLRDTPRRSADEEDVALSAFGCFCRGAQGVAYAVCYVVSEAERNDLLLQVGGDDQAKVYLNGHDIYKQSLPRALNALDPIGPVTLRKGTNVLVLKVVNQAQAWQGCARFVDREGNPAEGLRVSLTLEP